MNDLLGRFQTDSSAGTNEKHEFVFVRLQSFPDWNNLNIFHLLPDAFRGRCLVYQKPQKHMSQELKMTFLQISSWLHLISLFVFVILQGF